ncbi:MAG TPA: c-type cytochrome [Caulobacteraceae bacterium]|nr:c-type cytochrome [Caulobacteraceae bacterium]
MRQPLAERLVVSLLVLLAATPALAADGREAFRTNCESCHTLDGHSTKSGPSLKGVVWRKIAVLPDFAYTGALRSMVGTWTPDRLDAFLHNTQAAAPGSDMFWDIDDGPTRRAIVDYLKTAK